MKFASAVLKTRVISILLSVLLAGFGIIAYQKLGRLAYPDFTIKTALVVTSYPGASPREVEKEVTDKIEQAVQSMGQLDYVTSISQESLSIVYVEIKDQVKGSQIPQVWDELRKKVGDMAAALPPGAGPSMVRDDFGDVFGVYFAISGESYSSRELKEYAKYLKKELLLVDEVAKIDFWGEQTEVVYVEFARSRLSELGISPDLIFATLASQNLVSPAGKVKHGPNYIRFSPTGEFSGEQAIADLYITGGDGRLFRLGDIARVYRGYKEPTVQKMLFNGREAVGLGVSTEKGGNVVRMGAAVMEKIKSLESMKPPGMNVDLINFQAARVTQSLNEFMVNLVEAVAIVILLLLIFMGLRSGLLIGGVLLLSILSTFVGMWLLDITLQLISLGALVLALGMLVDNAIVVTDVFLIGLARGLDRKEAAMTAVKTTMWPLLGATLVAILAFVPIGLNPSNTGEFCRSLFDVMAISLLFSWIFAITVTPVLCVRFLKKPSTKSNDPYDTRFYRVFRGVLHACIRKRWITLAVLMVVLVCAVMGFQRVPKFFFPESTRNQFTVDYWRAQGTHINEVERDVKQINDYIRSLKGVDSVTAFVGEGSLRFVLPYNYHTANTSYAQLLVQVDDYHHVTDMLPKIRAYISEHFPDSEFKAVRFKEGPPVEYAVEARFRGPDAGVIQEIADQAKQILHDIPQAVNVRDDWRQPVKVFKPVFTETRARWAGISRSDISKTFLWNFSGMTVGIYREKDELLPIVSRPLPDERASVSNFNRIQVYSPALNQYLPVEQVVDRLELAEELPLIQRRNRMPTITVQCDPAWGQAADLEKKVRPLIQALELPPGVSLEWGGESEESAKGQAAINAYFPACLLGMFILVVCLFNGLKEAVIIFLCIPFSFVGVTLGLLSFSLAFGFMSILGFLGLTGMLVKNAIVLLDQVSEDVEKGKTRYQAVMDAAVSRLRPVTMSAGTTILGMAPLLFHPFFASMAATIMGGLLVATGLTLVVVPVLYSLFFRIKKEEMKLEHS
ncbi:efflux RND transporter permease subunit [Desulfospira joergensenii]|uniref:efflux RND transporter permease subunit n=1 Tax=Desulfospira joergensenii TaxID=53329 RepID=UPI0003B2FF81|nr:efflux RND transporter permease subunit [Desulfospira joergensenii]